MDVAAVLVRILIALFIALSLPACSFNKMVNAADQTLSEKLETKPQNEINKPIKEYKPVFSKTISCKNASQENRFSPIARQYNGLKSSSYLSNLKFLTAVDSLNSSKFPCEPPLQVYPLTGKDTVAIGQLHTTSSFVLLENRGFFHVATAFKEHIKIDQSLKTMRQHIYDQAQHLDFVSTLTFVDMLLTRLPKYRALFESVGDSNGLDWQWLAAMAYQESHWNPKAVSPTGVQGLMMLTQVTARELGITDRVDPVQSVHGGARYLMYLKQRLSKDIKGPDRLSMALAAYNVGFGHLQDARKLARKLGLNPNSWRGVKKVLPLLSEPKWYEQTRFGYARGHEPVKYVENIRSYYEILKWLTSKEAKLMILVENEFTDRQQSTL